MMANSLLDDLKALGFGTDQPINGADVVDVINKHWATLSSPLKPQDIADLVTTCFEGGSSYWIDTFNMTPDLRAGVRAALGKDFTNSYCHGWLYEQPGWKIHITIDEEDDNAFDLNADAVLKGTQLLQEKYPKVWAEIISEDYDAGDADLWLQLCILGEVVYG